MRRRSIAFAVVALLAILAGTGLWWLDRPQTLAAAARYAIERSGGQLALDGVDGTLLRRIHVDRVRVNDPTHRIVLDDVTLHWSPVWLLLATASFHDVHIAKTTVTLPVTTEAPKPPDSLKLPVRVRLHRATVDAVVVEQPDSAQHVRELVFDATSTWDAWQLTLARLATPAGLVTGHMHVDTVAPFNVDGALDVVREGDSPLALNVKATGVLERIQFDATLRAQTSSAKGTLIYRPFTVQQIERVDATATALDLRHLAPGSPEVVLDGALHAATTQDALRGTLTIANRTSGSVDRQRIPLAKIDAELAAQPGAWILEALNVDLGEAGKLSGSGRIALTDVALDVHGDGLNLRGLHSKLHATRFAARAKATGDIASQKFDVSLEQPGYKYAVAGTFSPGQLNVQRARAVIGEGTIDASGTLAFDDTRSFQIKSTLTRFDPSRLGDFKPASLNARVDASGKIEPALALTADVDLKPSTAFGLPASGKMQWRSLGIDDPRIAMDTKLSIGQTQIDVKGSMENPRDLRLLDLRLGLAGADLQQLYTITGLPFPPTPEYKVEGHLRYADNVWTFKRFSGVVGRSDLSGDFVVDRRSAKPFMRADVTSQRLDMRDLSGFIGAQPTAPPNPAGRVLPHTEYRLDMFNAANADIRFTGQRIRNEALPLNRMTTHLVLKDGVLTLDPLDFSAAGGDIQSAITLDGRGSPINTIADVRARNLKLNRLAPTVKAVVESAGTLDGRARLTMRGNSIAAMLGSANGDVVAMMKEGAISDLVLRLADLDIANALVVMARGDRNVPIGCAVIDLEAKNGVFTPRTFALDAEHTTMVAEGHIDMSKEELALKLIARPKKGSVFALGGPINVEGTFEHSAVRPDLTGAIAKGGAAIALGILATPAASALAFIQPGSGETNVCAPKLTEAERFVAAERG